MNNPCETPSQCLAALAELAVEENRIKMQKRHVRDELARIVLDAISRGRLPAHVIRVDERALRVALHRLNEPA